MLAAVAIYAQSYTRRGTGAATDAVAERRSAGRHAAGSRHAAGRAVAVTRGRARRVCWSSQCPCVVCCSRAQRVARCFEKGERCAG